MYCVVTVLCLLEQEGAFGRLPFSPFTHPDMNEIEQRRERIASALEHTFRASGKKMVALRRAVHKEGKVGSSNAITEVFNNSRDYGIETLLRITSELGIEVQLIKDGNFLLPRQLHEEVDHVDN